MNLLDSDSFESIALRDFRYFTAADLRTLSEPLVVKAQKGGVSRSGEKLAVVVPYAAYVQFQEVLKKSLLRIEKLNHGLLGI